MKRALRIDRWFIYAVASVIAVFLILIWQISLYDIEQEYSYAPEEIFYSIKLQRKASQANHYDISKWKTYRNEKYGFEFKYPPLWSFKSFDSDRNEFTAEVYFIIPQGKGLVSAGEGGIVSIFFSESSAETVTKFQHISEVAKSSPNFSYAIGVITCITENGIPRLCSAKAPSGGIAVLNV